jgi:hypothetical protein
MLPAMTANFWARTFARMILSRITSYAWQTQFLMLPDEHNRCFNVDFVRRCVQSDDLAYDLLVHDFLHLNGQWQERVSGRTYAQWCEFSRA